MPVRRTTGVFPGGGTVVLQGLPGRKAIRFQNQAAHNMTMAFASGFTIQAIAPSAVVHEGIAAGTDIELLQGAITLGGTAGDAFDCDEAYG